MTIVKLNSPWEMLGSSSRRLKIAEQWCVRAENYSSLPQCGSSKRLQLRWQDLKSNDMAASEDGGGTAVAGALGRKISQQEHGIRSVVVGRQEKIAAEARRKHVVRQVKIAAGAQRKLALSSARASMLLGSKLRGGGAGTAIEGPP